jgi:hypothetical protein
LKKVVVTAVIIVILVLSAFAALSLPHVKAQTTDATILSYTWYTAPANTVLAIYEGGYAGDLVVVGEVENTGTTTLGQIDIAGAAYNSSNTLVCSTEDPLLALPLAPGQKAPFYMDFNPIESITRDDSWVPDVTAAGNVTLRVSIADATNQTVYAGLTTTNLSGFDNSGVYTVQGDVENTGSQTPQNVWVATTFYNSAGKVIGLNYTSYLTPSPSPGNSVPFAASPTDNSAALSNDVKNYTVLVLSSPPSSSSGTPQPTSSPSTSPTTSPTSSTTPKQTQAPMNSLVTYGAVAAVVIIVAALAALTLFRTRRRKGQFEQPPPPPPPPPPP